MKWKKNKILLYSYKKICTICCLLCRFFPIQIKSKTHSVNTNWKRVIVNRIANSRKIATVYFALRYLRFSVQIFRSDVHCARAYSKLTGRTQKNSHTKKKNEKPIRTHTHIRKIGNGQKNGTRNPLNEKKSRSFTLHTLFSRTTMTKRSNFQKILYLT